MFSGLLIFFGQNRLIIGHNIDKNYIFIQRKKNCQEDMLHFISKLSFSIRIGRSELFSTARALHPAERPRALSFHLWTAYITMKKPFNVL